MNVILKKIKLLIPESLIKNYFTEKYFQYLLLSLALIIGVYLKWNIQDIIFLVFIVWQILNPLPSRFLAKIALTLLIFAPIFVAIDREVMAETFVVYAYYFLILTVVMAIYENKKNSK